MEKRYMYSVNPVRAIQGLSGDIKSLRSPKSLLLNLADVELCLKNAVLYRRFSNRFEKVTSLNYKRFHNEKYMTEEEYEEFLKSEQSKNSGTFTQVDENSEDTEPEVVVAEEEPVADITPDDTATDETEVESTEEVESSKSEETETDSDDNSEEAKYESDED